jgi:hypothetical protein
VKYVSTPFCNHNQNKKKPRNEKKNREDIEDHFKPRCNALVTCHFYRFAFSPRGFDQTANASTFPQGGQISKSTAAQTGFEAFF